MRDGFQPGDIVVDRDQDPDESYQPLYVLAISDIPASEKVVTATGKTVAEHNPEWPSDCLVARVAYESGLDDAYGTRWREHVGRIDLFVERESKRSNRYPNAYDFPVERLAHARPRLTVEPSEARLDDDALDELRRRLSRFVPPGELAPEEVPDDA